MRAARLVPALLAALAFLAVSASRAQSPPQGKSVPHFYDVDKEVKLEGAVREIRFEPRYEGTAPFLVLVLDDKPTGAAYVVEVSPAWFFEIDLHKGEKVRLTGSLVSRTSGTNTVIAREVHCQGETIVLRDRHGFPNWRGGPMMRHRKRGPGI
jgi:hypothetical protein